MVVSLIVHLDAWILPRCLRPLFGFNPLVDQPPMDSVLLYEIHEHKKRSGEVFPGCLKVIGEKGSTKEAEKYMTFDT
jgi:hypothetical protein